MGGFSPPIFFGRLFLQAVVEKLRRDLFF